MISDILPARQDNIVPKQAAFFVIFHQNGYVFFSSHVQALCL